MFIQTRIACPVDFSDVSRNALDYAAGLARCFGVRLDVIHVHRPPVRAIEPAKFEAWHVVPDEVQRELDSFVGGYREAGLEVRTIAENGYAVNGALEILSRIEPDLVVVGTHGRSGMSRWWRGSFAEDLVRRCPFPVLFVRLDQEPPYKFDYHDSVEEAGLESFPASDPPAY